MEPFCLYFTDGWRIIYNHHKSKLFKKSSWLSNFSNCSFCIFCITRKSLDGTAPILTKMANSYSNPLPHVLILTAIVVGVATTALGLALVVRIRNAYATIEDEEISKLEDED